MNNSDNKIKIYLLKRKNRKYYMYKITKRIIKKIFKIQKKYISDLC